MKNCPTCGVPADRNSNKAGARYCGKCRGLVEDNEVINLRFNCPECKEPQLVSPVMQISFHRGDGENSWVEFQYFPSCVDCKIKLATVPLSVLLRQPLKLPSTFQFENYTTGGKLEA